MRGGVEAAQLGATEGFAHDKVKQSYLRLKAIFSVGAYWSGGLFQGCQPIVDQVQVT